MVSNVVYNEKTGTYVAKGSSDDTTNASTSTNPNYGKSAEEIKYSKEVSRRKSEGVKRVDRSPNESIEEYRTKLNRQRIDERKAFTKKQNKVIQEKREKDIKQQNILQNVYNKRIGVSQPKTQDEIIYKIDRPISTEYKTIKEVKVNGKVTGYDDVGRKTSFYANTKSKRDLDEIEGERAFSKQKNIKVSNTKKDIVISKSKSKFEERIYKIKEREKNLQDYKSAIYSKLRIAPKKGGNFLIETAKATGRFPFEVVSIPTFIGGRIGLTVDALFQSKATRQELKEGLRETPKAMGGAFDPRTPEGLVNLAAITLPVVGKSVKTIKTSGKGSIIKGDFHKIDNSLMSDRVGSVSGVDIIQPSVSTLKNSITKTKQFTEIGKGRDFRLLEENIIQGKDFSVSKNIVYDRKGNVISNKFVSEKPFPVESIVKENTFFEGKTLSKDLQSGDIVKGITQNIESFGSKKVKTEGIVISKITKEVYGSSFDGTIVSKTKINIKEGNIQTVRLSKKQTSLSETGELIAAKTIKGKLSFTKGRKGKGISFKKKDQGLSLTDKGVIKKIDITRKTPPKIESVTEKHVKGIGADLYTKKIEVKSEVKKPFDNKKGLLKNNLNIVNRRYSLPHIEKAKLDSGFGPRKIQPQKQKQTQLQAQLEMVRPGPLRSTERLVAVSKKLQPLELRTEKLKYKENIGLKKTELQNRPSDTSIRSALKDIQILKNKKSLKPFFALKQDNIQKSSIETTTKNLNKQRNKEIKEYKQNFENKSSYKTTNKFKVASINKSNLIPKFLIPVNNPVVIDRNIIVKVGTPIKTSSFRGAVLQRSKLKAKQQQRSSYDVYAKENKRWKKIGEKQPRNKSIARGSSYVDKGPSNRFKLKRSGKTTVKDIKKPSMRKFNTRNGMFIEKRQFQNDSIGEKKYKRMF